MLLILLKTSQDPSLPILLTQAPILMVQVVQPIGIISLLAILPRQVLLLYFYLKVTMVAQGFSRITGPRRM
jgi:hypothetical protein